MGDSIIWKEAKSHQDCDQLDVAESELTNQDCSEANQSGLPDKQEDERDDSSEDEGQIFEATPTSSKVQSKRAFSHHQVNLRLRRNITALADPSQHNPKPDDTAESQNLQPFDHWLDNALVAISPSADIILFSSHIPEKLVFIAKLRMEPVHQYTTKALDIPLDFDEQITSLLCLPIMSAQRTSLGLVDWTALVVGLSSGYVKFYTEQSICLLSLKFCDEPVVSLKLQTQKVNTNARSQSHFASIVDELFITYKSCAIAADGIGLYENLRISKDDVVKSKLNYEPAYNLTNLPTILTCQKWKFNEIRGTKVLDADLLGMRCTTRFDTLKSDSIHFDYVSSKSFTRAIVLVGRNPSISCYREAKETVSHSYTEMIGSLLPFWSKPPPTRVQLNEISCSSSLCLFDKERLATSIVTSPDKRLAAMTDDYGRVTLVDVTNWLIVRIWKGYRNAQCGWVEVKRDEEEPGTPHASFLVIYAPKRGLLEIWSAQRGPRVAAFNVGKSCRLLYAGYKMLNMRAESSHKSKSSSHLVDQSYSNNCYLLDAKSETIFLIELPYTYSLYKYGDLKSRDRLLINELFRAIQHDAEVSSLSEIVQRMALAESLKVSIQKITSELLPDKIMLLMENLINKIMKDYDNHAGETMSDDDLSIVELCKRVIRLCSMFSELSQSAPSNLSLPDVNQRLIEQYDEHPQEVDEFAEKLGWDASEVLRYLSLLALERSYRKDPTQNTWPNMGEPLEWFEFVSCFDLERINYRLAKRKLPAGAQHSDKISIKLKESTSKFLREDRVIKTYIFMYNNLSESFYRISATSSELKGENTKKFNNCYTYIEPASRLILLFQFWLSTKLCNHWKMWAFLQNQVGIISDELRVIVMTQENDELLIQSWKKIYQMILESDNVYAAIIATAAIRSDTLRMIGDNEKREKLARDSEQETSIDWECLCVDAERMSIFSGQLEDVFLLSLLLRYSPDEGRLVDKYVYRVPRITVANILRGGPTIVSELIAQWVVQTNMDPKIFTKPYGTSELDEQADNLIMNTPLKDRSKLFALRSISDNGEHTKELLHHIKTSFPRSLDPDVIFLNCIWEFCNRWTNSHTASEKNRLLDKAFSCLYLLSDISLRHNSASWAYKTFFQRTFERLTILIETNSTILSPKCLRSRDALSRRELNMSESCLDDFVSFCFRLSDFILSTCRNVDETNQSSEEAFKLKQRLMSMDEWWSSPSVVKILNKSRQPQQQLASGAAKNDAFDATNSHASVSQNDQTTTNIDENRNSLLKASISNTKLFEINSLIELNRLTTLMVLIFRLKIIKAYPLRLIGEESRQALKLDLQQSPTTGLDMKTRSGLLDELRPKFARKCIVSIVARISEDTCEFDEYDGEDVDTDGKQLPASNIDGRKHNDRNVEQIKQQTKIATVSTSASTSTSGSHLVQTKVGGNSETSTTDVDADWEREGTETHESMTLFTHLLSLACEWQINCDELHLELAFELYRCNHDKLASMIATRIQDKQTLANGLLKICSQRVLVLFGLSSQLSTADQWRKRVDKWSLFQPNVASWLKSIQEEETRHELAYLNFSENLKQIRLAKDTDDVDSDLATDFNFFIEQSLGLRLYVLKAICERTKLVLETVTNYLDGQANRLSYDLLQLLESNTFDKFLLQEKKNWSKRREKVLSSSE